jgi:hypothetical protein
MGNRTTGGVRETLRRQDGGRGFNHGKRARLQGGGRATERNQDNSEEAGGCENAKGYGRIETGQ